MTLYFDSYNGGIIGLIVYNRAKVYKHQNVLKIVVYVVLTDQ